jgi:DNA-binding MarR family transcriptional regulator
MKTKEQGKKRKEKGRRKNCYRYTKEGKEKITELETTTYMFNFKA